MHSAERLRVSNRKVNISMHRLAWSTWTVNGTS